MPNPPNLCPTCQAPIPEDAPGGLCPACLLLGAVGPTQGMPGALAGAPSLEEVAAAFPELEVIELFAHGGMGVIFKARQLRLDRLVALKILPPDLARQAGFIERFTREARALAKLSHPHIVAVYDFGERAGFCYLTMEFVDGVNLRQAMRAGIKPEQALALVPGVCEALQFAHDHGVLHRDIKPENILLDTKGNPKLADFGIAKMVEEKLPAGTLTMSGATLGTAAYMAPEQIEKPSSVDHRADIYSLGVVIYEMLTGELPLGRFAAPSAKAKVNAGVDEVVLRALEKERERRQQSATEVKTQVEHATAPGAVPPGLGDEEWVLRCPACGHVNSIGGIGVRWGAASVGKRIMARCPACQFTGLTPLLPAKQARAERFVPNPRARQQQGRAFAIAGALLNIVPIVLVTLAVWPTLRLAGAWPNLVEGYDALRPDTRQVIIAFLVPAAIAASAALGLTAAALWGCRYRAPWFFRWLISYGIVTAPALIGIVILGYIVARRREFFAIEDESSPGAGAAVTPGAHEHTEGSQSVGVMRPLLLMCTVISALLVPLAAVHSTVGNFVSPGTLAVLTAIFGAVYGLWPGQPSDTRPEPAGRFPWQVPLIFGAMALPFGVLAGILVQPVLQQRGFSWQVGLTVAAVVTAVVALYSAIVAAIFRGVRRSGAPRWLAGAIGTCVALLLPFTLMVFASSYTQMERPRRTESRYQKSPPVSVVEPGSGPFIGHWSQGSVELVAITRHRAPSPWWRMDGSEAREGPFINKSNEVFVNAGERAYEFYFRTRNLPPGASTLEWMIENARASSSGGIPALAEAPDKPLGGLAIIACTLPETLQRVNIKAGLSYDPWHTLSTSSPINSIGSTVSHQGLSWNVTHGTAFENKDGELVVTFHYPSHESWHERVTAVNQAGEEIATTRHSRIGQQSEWQFRSLPLAAVKELRFQVRPIRWVEFRDVALSPGFTK